MLVCLICGPSWLHVSINKAQIFTIQPMEKVIDLTIGGISAKIFGAILKMELDATITLDILVQIKVGEMRVFHVLEHQIWISF